MWQLTSLCLRLSKPAFLCSVVFYVAAVTAQQPPPLQLNVPYHCPGNNIVVVKHCEKRNGTEFCSLVKGAENGLLGDEISMPKAQAAALGLVCTAQGGPASQSPTRPVPSGRMANPPSLNKMPTNALPLATSNSNAASGSAASSGASGAPDPSIAKARAANVDTKVLGMALGEPLQVPTCQSMFESKTCLQEEGSTELVEAVGSMFGMKPAAQTAEDRRQTGGAIRLGSDDCPSWMSDCFARLLIYDGRLVAIDVSTKGHTVDQVVVRQLREKYGPPTLVKPIAVTPHVGNPFNANSLEWKLPGLHVVYDVVIKGEAEGEITNTEVGDIGVETEAAYQRRTAKDNQKAKPKL